MYASYSQRCTGIDDDLDYVGSVFVQKWLQCRPPTIRVATLKRFVAAWVRKTCGSWDFRLGDLPIIRMGRTPTIPICLNKIHESIAE